MPCHDHDPSNDPQILKAKVNHLTDMLCRTCEVAEIDGLPADVIRWWDDHRKRDAEEKRVKAKYDQIKASGHPTPFWELTEAERGIIWNL
jgi:hypothetical protein